MKHIKTYQSMNHMTPFGEIIIEGPLSSTDLQRYYFHDALTAFRPAQQQFKAILQIADLTEGRMIIADRKSTRLNSSHVASTYAVFCLIKNRKRNQR